MPETKKERQPRTVRGEKRRGPGEAAYVKQAEAKGLAYFLISQAASGDLVRAPLGLGEDNPTGILKVIYFNTNPDSVLGIRIGEKRIKFRKLKGPLEVIERTPI